MQGFASRMAGRLSIALLLAPGLLAPVLAAATVPAPELYERAAQHLRKGRWYEHAIGQLKNAVKQEPAKAPYRLALGCAQADRAASIAYAALFTKMLEDERDRYSKDVKEWEAAQKVPQEKRDEPRNADYSSLYDAPRPTPPPRRYFETKDDYKRFRLTPAQTLTRVRELGTEAIAQWKQARELTTKPQEQAEAAYVQGWGLELLRKAWLSLEDKEAASALPDPARKGYDTVMRKAHAEALQAMRDAVRAVPDSAVYWQSLGDLYRGDALFYAPDNPGDDPHVIEAYDKSLALQPRNPALWYCLYEMQAKGIPVGNTATPEWDRAFLALQKAAQGDPGNAFPQYLMAALLFRNTTYGLVLGSAPDDRENQLATPRDERNRKGAREGLAAVERGNAAFAYHRPVYAPPVPELMAAAAGYGLGAENSFWGINGLRELARACSGYARLAARQNDFTEAMRASRAVIGLGYKLIGNWPLHESSLGSGEFITTLTGVMAASSGYATLQKVYEEAADRAAAREVAAEYEALQRQRKAYTVTIFSPNTYLENY